MVLDAGKHILYSKWWSTPAAPPNLGHWISFFCGGKEVKLKGHKITIASHNSSQFRWVICKPELRAMEDPTHFSKLMGEAVRLPAGFAQAPSSFPEKLPDAADSKRKD
jgi:hypothetical protein